jgi:tetratricopeptide (TPR) repeat protein
MDLNAALRTVARGAILFLLSSAALAATPAGSVGNPPEDPESREAAILYEQHNLLGALPIYERLSARLPENTEYAERAAECLMTAVQSMAPGAERDAAFEREKAAAARARALGANGPLLQIVLDHAAQPQPSASAGMANPKMALAEQAFGRADFDTALKLYLEIADADPKSYESRLYAGDVYFQRHDIARAGEWYGKAVAVDPDRETAHRYWGDALAKDGQRGAAYEHFREAVIADPYSRRAWLALSTWAKSTHAELVHPRIPAPRGAVTANDKGGMTISVDAKSTTQAGAAWLTYSMTSVLWRESKFKEAYPDEGTYRHSLAEEVTALKMALVVAGDAAKNTKEYGDLARLDADGMLEPYVLLSAPDEGISKDYAGYRASHRDQLRTYIDRYVVHRAK